jgi:anti-sigma B factor antagonist
VSVDMSPAPLLPRRAHMSASHETKRPRSSNLAIDRRPVDDRTMVLAVEGELDLWSAPELKRELCDVLDAGCTRLVLDLGRVGFIDSTALGVMVGVHRRLSDEDRLVIAEAGPEVLRVLELSGLASSFQIYSTREAAVECVTEDASGPIAHAAPPLTADAALMLGIASTAMPFALSTEDQAARWLRALRTHGEAGALLASLGVSEAPVVQLESDLPDEPSTPGDVDAVATVTDEASRIAAARGSGKLGTTDVLLAVTNVYGATFYRVLAAHGVDPAELSARVAPTEPAPAKS